MNNTNTSAVSNHQHMVRNERGQFAKELTTPRTYVQQAAADADVNLWRWLSQHGYSNVEPSEVFASSGGVQ